jgi:xylulose-5-phosphate/fructose-6-phosphate phosphoketolase
VVDLGVLMSPDVHPHGMDNISFEGLFTHAAPVIFAHHGYPAVIHSMMHGRANEARFHVRGFKDAGTTTTPFDMVVLNGISRFDLAKLALTYVPRLRSETSDVIDMFDRKLYEHRSYIRENFEDLPEITNWSWTADFSDPAGPPPLAVGQPRAALFTDS